MSAPKNCAEAIEQNGTMFKWDMPSRTEEEREADIAKATNWRAVCVKVNEREDYCCRVCHRRCNPSALSMLHKGHHHHIEFRSAQGEDTVENVCLLCADCHDLIHKKKALQIEGNAEEALTFSRRHPETREFYVWRQEVSPGVYARD